MTAGALDRIIGDEVQWAVAAMQTIATLWSGQLPLGRAFWAYAVVVGLLINLAAAFLALIVVAAGGPAALAVAVHLAPIPWIIVAAVGVWRSAGRPEVGKDHGALARAVVILWSALLVVV